MASVAISGVLWGVAGGLFYVADQPEQGLFLGLLIVGMCAAATASLSYHRIAYSVAALLEQHIRRGADLVARIGGEEFAIILPDTDLKGVVALAENIRMGLRKLANSNYREIPEVTMSFGVSSLVPDSSIDARLLFSQADAAVYKAKRKGKDRIVYPARIDA